jgi:hypothetical protein
MGTDLLEIRSGPSGPHPSAGTPLPQRGEGAGLVAAGSPVARRPPHRSRRAPKQKGGKRKGKRKGHRKCLGARRCILSGTPAGVPRFSAAPRRCRFAQPPATIRDASGIPGSTTSPVCMGPHPFAWERHRQGHFEAQVVSPRPFAREHHSAQRQTSRSPLRTTANHLVSF